MNDSFSGAVRLTNTINLCQCEMLDCLLPFNIKADTFHLIVIIRPCYLLGLRHKIVQFARTDRFMVISIKASENAVFAVDLYAYELTT